MFALGAALAGLAVQCAAVGAAEYKPGVEWAEPKIIDPGPPGGPPSDAIVLFDGKDMSAFDGGEKWIVENGVVTGNGGSIRTKRPFGDVQLHLEYAAPEKVEGSGQGRGNSGVLFMSGRYEVQILDSYENVTYYDGQAAAIYKQHPPLVNACRKPGEWQTYDIIFTAPRFDLQGRLMTPAYATVLHNGVLVQNHFKLAGDTPYNRPPSYTPHPAKMPLELQYHRNPVRFRNIWIREIQEIKGTRVAQPMVEEAPRKEGARQETAPKGLGQKKAKKQPGAQEPAPEPAKQQQ
jgi:hypothetical protein